MIWSNIRIFFTCNDAFFEFDLPLFIFLLTNLAFANLFLKTRWSAENPMGAVNIHVLIKLDHFVALVKLVMLVMENLVKLHIFAFSHT